MIRPQSRAAQALALFIVLALILLIWQLVLRPAMIWQDSTALRLGEVQSDIERLDQSLLSLAAERQALSGGENLEMVWTAEQSGQASALVQGRLSNLSQEHGVSLRSISPLPDRDLPLARGVGFRIEFEAPLDRLVLFLVELEHSAPLLVIERATMRRLVRPGEPETDSGAEGLQPELFVQMDVIAPVQIVTADTEDDT